MAKEKKEKKVKNDKRSFMKEFKAELKKVVWPSSKQMVNNVTAVITIVVLTAAIVFCLDFVFAAMNDYGINKLKTHVQTTNSQSTNIEEQTNNTVDNTNNEVNTEDATNNQEANNDENAQNNNSVENVAE